MSAPLPADRCTRGFIAVCLLAGVLSVILILDYTGYPYPTSGYWIFQLHLRTQDIPAAALLMLLVLAAWLAPAREALARLVEALGRRPWQVAAAAFVLLCLGALSVELNHPVAQDEYAALFQSRAFAAGHLTGRFPPELIPRLIPQEYRNHFLYASGETGAVASAYWPGFALLLTPFAFLGIPWACNAMLAALALVLMADLAVRLSGDVRAAGWALLLALASPQFTASAITYYSMTAHLVANLVFASLLLQAGDRRVFLAGVVGSFALVLHNPLPHALFALPWIVWLARQPAPWRRLAILAAGYAPVALLIGFGWAYVLSGLQGEALHGLFPPDANPLHRALNFLWIWHIKMRTVLADSDTGVLGMRVAELVRLWNWAVPGLLVLAGAGWWLGRRDQRVLLLGLSFACTVAGYFMVGFTQGHGWGARYVHSAWGALPVLGALALVRARGLGCEALERYVAALAALSLIFATALRAVQVHGYVEGRLANRPPFAPGVRQVVLVRHDSRRYTADLVQNDPLLRDKVWFMVGVQADKNAAFMHSRFPDARRVMSDQRGEVWRLE